MQHDCKVVEMRGTVTLWDGKFGNIKTRDGIDVPFFPIHLIANGYAGRVKVGDTIYFRCTVIDSPSYCLKTIRAVAVS